jgi:hypothetical protein
MDICYRCLYFRFVVIRCNEFSVMPLYIILLQVCRNSVRFRGNSCLHASEPRYSGFSVVFNPGGYVRKRN